VVVDNIQTPCPLRKDRRRQDFTCTRSAALTARPSKRDNDVGGTNGGNSAMALSDVKALISTCSARGELAETAIAAGRKVFSGRKATRKIGTSCAMLAARYQPAMEKCARRAACQARRPPSQNLVDSEEFEISGLGELTSTPQPRWHRSMGGPTASKGSPPKRKFILATLSNGGHVARGHTAKTPAAWSDPRRREVAHGL